LDEKERGAYIKKGANQEESRAQGPRQEELPRKRSIKAERKLDRRYA